MGSKENMRNHVTAIFDTKRMIKFKMKISIIESFVYHVNDISLPETEERYIRHPLSVSVLCNDFEKIYDMYLP